jgi:hypothetical protein
MKTLPLICFLLLVACTDETTEFHEPHLNVVGINQDTNGGTVIEMQDLKISSDFDFNTQRKLTITISVSDNQALSQVDIFLDSALTQLVMSSQNIDSVQTIEVWVPNYSASLSIVWFDKSGSRLGTSEFGIKNRTELTLQL